MDGCASSEACHSTSDRVLACMGHEQGSRGSRVRTFCKLALASAAPRTTFACQRAMVHSCILRSKWSKLGLCEWALGAGMRCAKLQLMQLTCSRAAAADGSDGRNAC